MSHRTIEDWALDFSRTLRDWETERRIKADEWHRLGALASEREAKVEADTIGVAINRLMHHARRAGPLMPQVWVVSITFADCQSTCIHGVYATEDQARAAARHGNETSVRNIIYTPQQMVVMGTDKTGATPTA